MRQQQSGDPTVMAERDAAVGARMSAERAAGKLMGGVPRVADQQVNPFVSSAAAGCSSPRPSAPDPITWGA